MQPSFLTSGPVAACLRCPFSPARGRGLFCFLAGLLLLGSPLLVQTITTVAGMGVAGFSGDGGRPPLLR